ncbi:peptide/nickel transport system permease protein [Bosea sp. OK403]|jgi:peptide/nickel transport system permease protein|uniref:ABC transporter permease n=1 Tax=Bosea sp. OK403 TaxID=1855286 RepID=UPI0008E845A8|nr:ABC transporter permease [Bosea sp. OK403]SFJ73757.1 peptide/nickel transport system permease protein [Bosea sp. OK403]
MLRFVGRRALYAVPLILVVIILMFSMLHLIPGDPVQALVGDYPVPPAYRQAIEEKYRLNDPFLVQVSNYLINVAKGDFGFSYQNQRAVLDLILERAPRTILLASVSFALAIPLGMAIGVAAGTTRSAGTDKFWTTTTLIVYAVPTFWLGQLLVMFFALHLGWLPTQGIGPMVSRAQGFAWLLEKLRYLALPVLAFGIHEGMRVARIMRASVIDTISQGYIITARAKGLTRGQIIRRHVLRNSSLPLVTIAGYAFGSALGGAVFLETVFTWPGLGLLLVDSIRLRDNMMVIGVVIFSALAVVAMNLIVDLLYAALDPRIRTVR